MQDNNAFQYNRSEDDQSSTGDYYKRTRRPNADSTVVQSEDDQSSTGDYYRSSKASALANPQWVGRRPILDRGLLLKNLKFDQLAALGRKTTNPRQGITTFDDVIHATLSEALPVGRRPILDRGLLLLCSCRCLSSLQSGSEDDQSSTGDYYYHSISSPSGENS